MKLDYKLDNLSTVIEFTDALCQAPSNNFAVIDYNIKNLYPKITDIAENHYFFHASETNKNLDSARNIFEWLLANKANRNSNLIAVGGGITTDIVGWAASQYMRGCHLIFVPTTLIAMIDAATGGKTAVNFRNTKNIIGSFYPAEKVIIDLDFLTTLSDIQIYSGLAEMIKYALLDGGYFEKLLLKNKKSWQDDAENLIISAIKCKYKFCQHDIRDQGKRRFLNLGHTFAHVIEPVSGFEIEHGRAVAIGINCAAKLSHKLKFISFARLNKIRTLLKVLLPENYLKIDEKHLNDIIDKGEKFFYLDKKALKNPILVLFKDEDNFFIYDKIDWNLFRDILIENNQEEL